MIAGQPLSQTQTDGLWIESSGSFSPQVVVAVAVGFGVLTWLYYWRETRTHAASARWLLPFLRAFLVTLLILILCEPVLVRLSQALERGHVLVAIDRSRSLARRDPSMKLPRKVALATTFGLLSAKPYEDSRTDALEQWAESTDVDMQRALADIEEMSRWDRAQRLLFDEDFGIFDDLSWPHVSELATAGEGVEIVALPPVRSAQESRRRVSLDRVPDVPFTNLSSVLEEAGRREIQALVLLTDGRHNAGGSPVELARELGERGVPVYTVGVGSAQEPVDLGVLDVYVPTTAYEEDRLEGKVVLKLSSLPDLDLTVSIRRLDNRSLELVDDDVLWQGEIDALTVGSSRILEMPFVIPERTLSRGRPRLVAEIEAIAGEASTRNNRLEFLLTVKKRELRVLLLDGRPRWTWRYLRKLFERDEKVFVNALLAGLDPDRPLLPRGDCDACFPATEAALKSYDLIVLGDLSRGMFRDDELSWIRRFVDAGGGLILIAGRRGSLASYAESDLAPLLPVRFTKAAKIWRVPRRLRLTDSGKHAPSLRLVDDVVENAEIWELLRPGRWAESAESVAGGEVWVESIAAAGAPSQPVLVHKRFGRGNVLYFGVEESWRWRYKIADQYHARFWSQQIDYFREEDFALRTPRLALDTDRATYTPGDTVQVRLQRSEMDGERQDARAVEVVELWRDQQKVRDVKLDAPPSADGVHEALVHGLEPGRYVLRPAVANHEDAPALPFDVRAKSADEDLFLAWDEDLLRRLALLSGGKYLREEQIDRLPALLETTSVLRQDTHRWPLVHGWWALTIIVSLLSVEWLLRKKAGLV